MLEQQQQPREVPEPGVQREQGPGQAAAAAVQAFEAESEAAMADGRPGSMAERLRRLQPAPEASRVRRAQQQLPPVEYDPAGGHHCP